MGEGGSNGGEFCPGDGVGLVIAGRVNEVDFRWLVGGLMGLIKGGAGKGFTVFRPTSAISIKSVMVGPNQCMDWRVKGG